MKKLYEVFGNHYMQFFVAADTIIEAHEKARVYAKENYTDFKGKPVEPEVSTIRETGLVLI